jgi:ribosomal protein L40E
MSTRLEDANDTMAESCENCGRETLHTVSIQLRTESRTGENVAYSREPYRVSACRVCGSERSIRMNNA